MDFDKAQRQATVTQVLVYAIERDTLSIRRFEDFPNAEILWCVSIHEASGSLPEQRTTVCFESEDEARSFAQKNSVGTIIESSREEITRTILENFEGNIFDDERLAKVFLGSGDQYPHLPFEVLDGAGVSKYGSLYPKVIDFLGSDRIASLKSRYSDNWNVVAEMEYCWENLPHSSAAFAAACYQYAYYILEDDYAAGYQLRDLEVLTGGIETAVKSAKEYQARQARRSAKGGDAQAQLAEERRKTFFKLGLETVSHWIWKSPREQLSYLKQISRKYDKTSGNSLFHRQEKLLSDEWFTNAISELRQSGQLQKAITSK